VTPLQFEQLYDKDWVELELCLERHAAAPSARSISGARFTALSPDLRASRNRAVAPTGAPSSIGSNISPRSAIQLIISESVNSVLRGWRESSRTIFVAVRTAATC
jgi:hypothetical protein